MTYNINTNLNALNSMYYLGQNQTSLSQSIARLSSGLRINTAGDDAAGLAISQKLDAQVRGLNQAALNSQNGISMVQTADGAMNSIENMVQRMRELAVEAANGTMSTTDLSAVNTELQQLQSQVNQTTTQTTYNGLNLLDGSLSTQLAATSNVQNGFVVVAGTNTSVSNVDVSQAKAADTFTFTNNLGKLTLSDGTNSQTIDLTGVTVAAGGAYQLNFSQLGVNVTVSSVAGETGANIAAGLTTKTVVTGAASGSASLQIGANAGNTMTIAFNRMDINTANSNAAMSGLATSLATFNTTQSTANASALITSIDTAINFLNGQRANMGAYQNRLQATVSNLQMNSNNMAAAESRIKDVDVSAEMVNFSKLQILQQAGTAILAQANQAPGSVLKLLQ